MATQVVSRSQWGARPPRSAGRVQTMTAVACHWEGPRMGTFPHESCPAKVRGIQAYHMDSKGWADIAYSGIVCPHGYIFEGRGRNIRTAANGTNAGNDRYHALCYLGGVGDPFTAAARTAFRDGFAWLGGIANGLVGHRDIRATACPGDDIEAWIVAGAPAPPYTPGPSPQPPTWAPPVPAAFEFMAYDPALTTGLSIGADGAADSLDPAVAFQPTIVTAPDAGGAPHVVVRHALTGAVLGSFYAYAQDMTAGVSVAVGDVDGDGNLEVVTTPGPGGGPHLRVFDLSGREKAAGWAYRSDMVQGVDVAIVGPGLIAVAPGKGGGPHVRVIRYADLTRTA